MTTPTRIIERVIPAALFGETPKAGTYFISQTGGSLLLVHMVRRVVGGRTPAFRLQGVRVRHADLPAGTAALPWPKAQVRAQKPPDGPLYGPPVARIPRSVQKAVERKRVVGLLIADKDHNRPVQTVRMDNATAVRGEWRDPDDLQPNRRSAKMVSGYRAREEVQVLIDNGTITPSLAKAARRLRREYELGEWGLRGGRNLAEEPAGFSAGAGPSESRLHYLEIYQATAAALRPHLLGILLAVVVHDQTIKHVAIQRRMNRSAVGGAVITALSFLKDYYKELDEAQKDTEV